jgi:hypothetical protein
MLRASARAPSLSLERSGLRALAAAPVFDICLAPDGRQLRHRLPCSTPTSLSGALARQTKAPRIEGRRVTVEIRFHHIYALLKAAGHDAALAAEIVNDAQHKDAHARAWIKAVFATRRSASFQISPTLH